MIWLFILGLFAIFILIIAIWNLSKLEKLLILFVFFFVISVLAPKPGSIVLPKKDWSCVDSIPDTNGTSTCINYIKVT